MIREDYQYILTKLRRVRELKGYGKLDEAMDDLRRVMDDLPEEPLLIFEFADCLRLKGNPDEAKTLALDALEKSPDRPEGHVVIGNIYLEEREYDKALDHFETAARIKKTKYVTSRIIRTLIDMGKLDHAGDLIREELTENPESLPILKYKAQVSAKQGKYQEAADIYEKMSRNFPIIITFS